MIYFWEECRELAVMNYLIMDFRHFLNKEFTMKEAQDYFDLKGRHLDRVLTLYKQRYLSRKKLNKIKFSYKLTKKYAVLYNKLKTSLKGPISQ